MEGKCWKKNKSTENAEKTNKYTLVHQNNTITQNDIN